MTIANNTSKVLRLVEGAMVGYEGGAWVIVKINDLEKVTIRRVDGLDQDAKLVSVASLNVYFPPGGKELVEPDVLLTEVSNDDWEEAKRRFDLLQPLLQHVPNRTAAVKAMASQAGVSVATIYNWHKRWLHSEKLSSLLPTKRLGGKGKGRLPESVEALIEEAITGIAEYPSQPTITSAYESLTVSCKQAGVSVPNMLTFKLRIRWRDQVSYLKNRMGAKYAQEKFDPVKANTIRADYPWHMVQIDHAILDVIVVHEKTNQPICRPWLTIAIDVNTRVVVGIYISLEHPSATSVGACLAHTILPKEPYIKQLELDALVTWPVWGVMRTLHMDNGKDFRGERLMPSFVQYLIERHFRPGRTPRYGAYIERLIGTFSRRMKVVPGATTGKIPDNPDYKPEEKARLTVSQIEKWFVLEVFKYHRTPHRGLNDQKPIEVYQQAFLKPGKGLPRALPPRRTDIEDVKRDFLPEEERAITTEGVQIKARKYWDPVLQAFLHYQRPGENVRTTKFKFKVDDRDVSFIWFFDEIRSKWAKIPSAAVNAVDVSRSEWRQTKKKLKEDGALDPSDQEIYSAVLMQRKITEERIEEVANSQLRTSRGRLKKPAVPKSEAKDDQKRRERKARNDAQDNAKPEQQPVTSSSTSSQGRPSLDDLPNLDGDF
jgi:putative transposase